MKTKLSLQQIQRLDDLINDTLLRALQEDICLPDMSDYKEEPEEDIYDEVYYERAEMLMNEAILYIKNNLS